MNKEKVLIFIWGSLSAVLIAMFVCSAFINTVKIYKLSGGTEISLDTGSIVELVLVCAVYYLSKYILNR